MRRVSIYAPKQTPCLPYARYDHERPGEATGALRGRVCRPRNGATSESGEGRRVRASSQQHTPCADAEPTARLDVLSWLNSGAQLLD